MVLIPLDSNKPLRVPLITFRERNDTPNSRCRPLSKRSHKVPPGNVEVIRTPCGCRSHRQGPAIWRRFRGIQRAGSSPRRGGRSTSFGLSLGWVCGGEIGVVEAREGLRTLARVLRLILVLVPLLLLLSLRILIMVVALSGIRPLIVTALARGNGARRSRKRRNALLS